MPRPVWGQQARPNVASLSQALPLPVCLCGAQWGMETPNARGTRNLIATLAEDQRHQSPASQKRIPAEVSAKIQELVGSNELMNAGELSALTCAARQQRFDVAWPRFYREYLRPAAIDCLASVSVHRSIVDSDKYFRNFEFSEVKRFFEKTGVTVSISSKEYHWDFSWPA